MNKKFNGTTVETNGVRSIAGGGTGAATAEQARINLGITGGGVTSYNDLTDKPTLGTAAATASTDYATAAQGTTADSALQPSALTPYRTSSDQDTIDAGKAATTHEHDDRYYTESEVDTLLAGKQAAGSYATAAQGAKADSALQSGAAISNISGLQTALDNKQAAGSYAPATGISPTAISGTAVVDSDARLTNSRTPTSHKSTHATGGTDVLTPADIGALTTSHYLESMGMSTTAVDTIPRIFSFTTNNFTSGNILFSNFTPLVNMSVTRLSVSTQGASTSATLFQMGLYSYNESTNTYTKIAETANDTTIATGGANMYTRLFSPASTQTLIAGTRYAFAVVAVFTGTLPLTVTNSGGGQITSLTPQINRSLGSTTQTNLPATVTGSNPTTVRLFGRVS
jgi:hypothetical protein